MDRTLVRIVVAAVLAFALVSMPGCGMRGDSLDATHWRLAEWTLSSLEPASFTITADFAGGRISGRSAVNSYSGSYQAGPGKAFSVGALASTEMASDPDAMRAESAYLTLLGQARSFAVGSGSLTLYDANGNESLIFKPSATK